AARDGLKAKLANSKTAELKTKSIEALRQVSAVLGRRPRGMLRLLKVGFVKSVKLPPKRRARAAGYSVSAAFRLARRRKQPWPRSRMPLIRRFEEIEVT